MRAADLSSADLKNPDSRVPLPKFLELTREAEAQTGNKAFTLHFAETVGMSDISVVGLIMEASSTMGEAFEQLQRYSRLAADYGEIEAVSAFELRESFGRLFMRMRAKEPSAVRPLIEAAFVRLTCGPRRFLEEPHVLSVQFTYSAPQYRAEYDRIFRCPVRFDAPMNALELHPDVASWTVSSNPQYAFSLLTRHADTLLSSLKARREWRGKTEKAILARLHRGEVTIEDISADLGFSRQTLFRKLKNEDTSFSQVLDDLRRKMAREFLLGRRTSVNEIAYLLGFSEAASFSRAFKKWEGISPSKFQKRNAS